MNINDNIGIELLNLLSKKSFDELTIIEKEFVLATSSEEEFNDLRETVLTSQKAMNSGRSEVHPNPQIIENLLLKYHKKNHKENYLLEKVTSLVNYRLPLYQPAMAFTLLFLLFHFGFYNSKTIEQTISKTIDTIYIEKTIPTTTLLAVADTNISITSDSGSTLVNKNSPNQQFNTSRKNKKELIPLEANSTIGVFDFKEELPNGKTINDDSLLASFFTVPN